MSIQVSAPLRAPRLSDRLAPAANNFDLLRLIASASVIISHAYDLAPTARGGDFVQAATGGVTDLGATAVKLFFFLSGMLVTQSILLKPRPVPFILKRTFRIIPALVVCMFICAFCLGTIVTTHDKLAYLSDSKTWNYFISNSTLWQMKYFLPGVFEGAPNGVNGSIWTLPIEFYCYLVLGGALCVGLLPSRKLGGLFAAMVVLIAYLKPSLLPHHFQYDPKHWLMAFSFAFGVLAALFADYVVLSVTVAVAAWVGFFLFDRFSVSHVLFYLALFYSMLVVFTSDRVTRLVRLPFDASYGTYLYGFAVQTTVAYRLPSLTVRAHQALSLVIALTFGVLSWHLVEKRAMRVGGDLARAIDGLVRGMETRVRAQLDTLLTAFQRRRGTPLGQAAPLEAPDVAQAS